MLLSRLALIALLSLFLSGCVSDEKFEEMAEKLASEEIRTEASRIGSLVLNKDLDGIKAVFHPDGLNETFDTDVAALWRFVPEEATIDRGLVGLNVFTQGIGDNGYTNYTFQYQYQFETSWLHMRLVLREEAEQLHLINIHLTPLQGDLREIHAFDLAEASFGQLLMLTALVLNPIFILVTFVYAFRMRKKLKSPKRWLGFMLFGLGAIQMNWTTGQVGYQILKFGLLGGGFITSSPYAPWVFTIYFPLTAVLFWIFIKTGRIGLKELHEETIVT